MGKDQFIEKVLKKCSSIFGSPLEDSLLFGPRTITDPENGDLISIDGYNTENNQDLLIYIDNVHLPFHYLDQCLKDLFYFEFLFSTTNFPVFPESSDFSRYLSLLYQHWTIKISTCYECILHSLNATFEMNLDPKWIKTSEISANKDFISNSEASSKINELNELIRNKVQNISQSKNLTNNEIRNKIVHYNVFDHKEISVLESDEFHMKFGLTDLEQFEFQLNIGNKSDAILQEVKTLNFKILCIMLPIFECLQKVYKQKFNEKLKE